MPLGCPTCKHLPADANPLDWFDEAWWREPCATCRVTTPLNGVGDLWEPRVAPEEIAP
jgi:hypothetical protein